MTPDERELLIRIDERVNSMHAAQKESDIPNRLKALEAKNQRTEGAIGLILFLVASGRLYDVYEFLKQLLS